MRGSFAGKLSIAVSAAVALLACAAPAALADAGGTPNSKALAHRPVCAAVGAGFARCHSQVVVDAGGAPRVTSAPAGYGPADLQSAYALPSATNGSGQTIAIVDAYDDPAAASDLATYRAQYGLPALPSCTTSTTAGCFRKVDQRGGGAFPQRNAGWAQEISLDLDMASATCPKCGILLVEADSNSFANLAAAEDTAARLGATAISNSYGGGEYAGEVNDQSHFNHPGVAITVSSGDSGYGTEFPAASRYVTAVGGTRLSRAAGSARGWSESAWTGAGSGCSAYVTKPSWQTDAGCARRTVADVSAVADPNTGVAVYDSVKYQGRSGWMTFGGTSASAPIVAGAFALAGNAATIDGSYPYTHAGSLFDVASGSNGSCGGSYLCTAVAGYDGPTGLGTPNGVAGF